MAGYCEVHRQDNECAKHLPNMARYAQKHLKIPMAVLAIYNVCYLPVMSKGNRWALKAFCLHISYMFMILMRTKLGENVVPAYLSGILFHKGESVAILSNNSTEFKNKVLKGACDQLGIKRLFSNLFHAQGNARVENVHNFLKRKLTKFLECSDLEWDELLPFTCYC